jgi:outer membrane murein-binding lipoprotein Lpp
MANKMALEKKIDLLVERFDGMSTAVDSLSKKVDGLEAKFGGLEVKVEGMSTKVDGLAAGVGELKTKVTVGFEESHRLLKLSLEGLAGLEETTVDRFDKMSGDHNKQFALLETFGVHVRKRVQKLEHRPKTRRPV